MAHRIISVYVYEYGEGTKERKIYHDEKGYYIRYDRERIYLSIPRQVGFPPMRFGFKSRNPNIHDIYLGKSKVVPPYDSEELVL